MKFKLALAAAAVVGLAGTAQAADLGKKAPSAANYVKVCDAYGAGFFYIPGSDTCLQIGGYVFAQLNAYHDSTAFGLGFGTRRGENLISTGARYNIHFDARTNTELGLLRSYIEVQQTIGLQQGANGVNGAGPVSMEKAYIQFAGLTAGRATSMFDFYTGDHLVSIFETAHSDSIVNLFAYTFSFGNGISASLSVEDPTTGNGYGRRWSVDPTVNTPGTSPYGAVKHPDYVANLNLTQAWGSAQVMAALHENTSSTLVALGAGNETSKMGYAVGAGVKVNLPMLGASDTLAVQAAYAKGAISYVSPDWYSGRDFYIDGFGNIQQTKAWSVAAGMTHGWTKTLTSSLTASYGSYDEPFGVDYKEWDVGGNLAWAPVTGLTITGEVEYKKVNFASPVILDRDAVVGFVRIRRDF